MATVLDATTLATASDALAFARDVLRLESEAIDRVCDQLDEALVEAADCIFRCQGNVVVTGMGKAGLVGQKLAATLASTGTTAFPLHPGDAVHGDLGRIRSGDLVLALSQSGETEEVTRLIPSIRQLGAGLIALTASPTSTLGRGADLCITLGSIAEACPLGLAPSASTTAMMAVGDALALLVSRMKAFGPEDFLRYHPGGSLGRKLSRVEDLMRTGSHVRTAQPGESVREVFVRLGGARRRSGAVLVVNDERQLLGIFTDSDLARLFELRREQWLDRAISEVMTANPVVVSVDATIAEAVELLRSRKLSELPVVDAERRLVGLVDITDLIGLEADDLEP
ncbi:KpsF/GutQ family sugar-phosphate isomerase [Tautonia rosea]|uniref:KpsF/GutQ family sugar-phosphate isomerase n=1 Tax=Tautonia rosea TaxID=2728037 RepID=UPI0014732C54|nr:KpsF/GutQ family sugar-phosphate isomerase [Tautonia rosea]